MDKKLNKLDEKCTTIFEEFKEEISNIKSKVRSTTKR